MRAPSAGLLVLTGCVAPCEPFFFPVMTVSSSAFDYGAVAPGERLERTVMLANEGNYPLGVGEVSIGGDGTATASFDVAWDACVIECDGDDKGGASVDRDTGDTGHPGDSGGSGACAGPDDTVFVLDPGCRIPLAVGYTADAYGDADDALVVHSVQAVWTGVDDDEPLPAYLPDPLHVDAVTWLHGESTAPTGEAILEYSPRSYDFGFVYPGVTAELAVSVHNTGDADFTFTDAYLGSTCPSDFRLVSAPAAGSVLAPGGDAELVVDYGPTAVTPAFCLLYVPAPDGWDWVSLVGNNSTAGNTAPTVAITSPAPGAAASTNAPLELVLAVADAEQPLTTLACTVYSVVLGGGRLASCTPSDESGVVEVSIPGSVLLPGADTLRVTVTDALGWSAEANVSVRIDTEASADDADGDGFAASGTPADCDDADPLTWPEATELADGRDNSCDGVVDEGTTASDDDGDGVAEADGDCDDRNDDVYPGAPERGDGLDNNCNGVIDEGTSLYDDDGDGYSELQNDCDDTEPGIHPGAVELCDGLDNDCDGLRDTADGCEGGWRAPDVIGHVLLPAFSSIVEGETTTIEARVVADDPTTVAYSWSVDGVSVPDVTGPELTFQGPEVADLHVVHIVSLVVTDSGGTDQAFSEVAVYEAARPPGELCLAPEEGSGCVSAGGNHAVGVVAGLAALLLARRRHARKVTGWCRRCPPNSDRRTARR